MDAFQSVTISEATWRPLPLLHLSRKTAGINDFRKKPILPKISMAHKAVISSGDKVYARWFGDEKLTVIKQVKTKSPFPHYVCELGKNQYIISKLHLSRKRIISEVSDGNRKQLAVLG